MAGKITDIAKAAGVSIATVSAVINEKGRISEATRKRVLDVVRELAYNTQAHKALPKGMRTGTLGLVLPIPSWDTNDFYYRAIVAATQYAREQGRDCKVLIADQLYRRVTEDFHKGRGQLGCDQLVFFCPPQRWREIVPALQAWHIPVAAVRRQADFPGITYLVNDDYQGMRLAAEHLADRGHTVIALLRTDAEEEDSLGRLRAYRDVVKERGLCADKRLELTRSRLDFDLPGILDDLRRNGLAVTGLATYGDHLAQYVLHQLLKAGIRIPQDLAVMGFDNDPISQKFYPPISTIDIPVEKMVVAACDAVLNPRPDMEGVRQVLTFGNELIIRQTT